MRFHAQIVEAHAFQSPISSLFRKQYSVFQANLGDSISVQSLTSWANNRNGGAFGPSWALRHETASGNCRSRRGSSPKRYCPQTFNTARGIGIPLHSQSEEEEEEVVAEQFQARAMANKGSAEERIKVLDMEEYFSGDVDRVGKFCEELREQCHTTGFFYVRNHGVPQELCDSFLQLARQFFDLPYELKMQLDYKNSPHFRGYMKIGVENTAGKTDFREQIDIGPDAAEDVDIVDGSKTRSVYPVYRRLHGPNQWPPEYLVPDFKPKAEEFIDQLGTLSMHLMQAIALSLGLRKDYFDSSFQHSPHYQMKVVRYPPKSESEDAETLGMFGVGEHSDSGFLSLLLQDAVGGLQALIDGGEWTDVPPKMGTIVVNLGEMLQLATAGYYVASVHRVQSQRGSASRYSVPFFFNPRLETDITAFNIVGKPSEVSTALQNISPLLAQENGVHKERITHNGVNRLFPVFGQNTFKSYSRSHPDSVRKHHPDLLQSDGTFNQSKLEHITPSPTEVA